MKYIVEFEVLVQGGYNEVMFWHEPTYSFGFQSHCKDLVPTQFTMDELHSHPVLHKFIKLAREVG